MEENPGQADAAKARADTATSSATAAKILVTGASGLLGGALMRRLRRAGEVVRVLIRRPAPELDSDPGIEVIYGDLDDPDIVDRAVAAVDLVYHVGSAMSGGKEAFEAGTIRGTKNVVTSCVRHKVKRLVHISSIILLDHAGHRPGEPIDESSALEPRPELRGLYTQAKLDAEQTVHDAIREHGLQAVILRPGQILGRGAEKFAPAGTIVFGGRWIVVGDGRLPLAAVYIEDVVDAMLLAAERDNVCGLTFHIVDSVNRVTQNDYIEACRRRVPSLRAMYVPGPVLMGVAALAGLVTRVTKVNLPISPYRLRSSRPLFPFDVRAARDLLAWTPRIGARRGLAAAASGRAADASSGSDVCRRDGEGLNRRHIGKYAHRVSPPHAQESWRRGRPHPWAGNSVEGKGARG